ncbi:MAG: phosphate ABC transporter permease PstA [Alphaproteobacteria bacterium]
MTEALEATLPGLKRRHAATRRLRFYGKFSVTLALGFLAIMIAMIGFNAPGALTQTQIAVTIKFDAQTLGQESTPDPAALAQANYGALIKAALRETFPQVKGRQDRRKLYGLVSYGAQFTLQNKLAAEPQLLGTTQKIWLAASDDIDQLVKGTIDASLPQNLRRVSDKELRWVAQLRERSAIQRVANATFFTKGDSREPELAGILNALIGSALTLLVCFVLSFPIGTMAAIYLEEFAPKNRLSDLIAININNLAAVPSIVFGLLGLAILLNSFGLPRSTPLVGGMVLALMTLPTIIIASRASLRAVPPSIREAALAIGASQVQTAFHHVAPLALPGMLTGAIIGMARALGDTAPLLMIGMVAFIADMPTSIVEPATALPVQVFLWADSPERSFLEKTSAAIMVLLAFLIVMNLAAVVLRRKFEQRF